MIVKIAKKITPFEPKLVDNCRHYSSVTHMIANIALQKKKKKKIELAAASIVEPITNLLLSSFKEN